MIPPLPDWWFAKLIGFLATPVLAALLGGYLVNRWKGREDHIEKRFDELCSSILETADLAADYWGSNAQDEGMLQRQAAIQGQIAKMAGLRSLLSAYVSRSCARELAQAESIFIRQTTGGEFGVHNRTAEPQRIVECHCGAADFVVAIRRARLSDLKGFRRRP